MVKDCIFCRIVLGELPCDTVYEDDLVLVFFDIAPITLGHALVIPKEHHTSATTLPPHLSARIMEVAPTIATALMRSTGSDGFNLQLSNGTCAGQVVPHVHLHLIPRKPDDGVMMPVGKARYESAEQKAEILETARKRLSQ